MHTIIHRAKSRGKGDYDWLTTRYSFSFAEWFDPARMGFGALRVLNDDQILPGKGFGMHGHKEMEIITLVMTGELTHKDSMGNSGKVHAGEVQVMSAGTGVMHSEFNASDTTLLSLFQIWIEPNKSDVTPHYAQKVFTLENKALGETPLVGPWGTEAPLSIHQDAWLSHIALDSTHPITYTLKKEGNGLYAFILQGKARVADNILSMRDAIGITESRAIVITTSSQATLLLIEVPVKNR
jgi:redox-sensitive bicupin YhaK (pirin superfamily)